MGQNGKGLEGHMPARVRSLLQEHAHAFLGDHRGGWLRLQGDASGGQGEAAVQTRIPFEPPVCMRLQKCDKSGCLDENH